MAALPRRKGVRRMNAPGCERERAMRRVQIAGFAMLECALYLDSHPDDQEALEYFRKYSQILACAEKEYEQRFGPLHLTNAAGSCKWDWIAQAWPWEYGAN